MKSQANQRLKQSLITGYLVNLFLTFLYLSVVRTPLLALLQSARWTGIELYLAAFPLKAYSLRFAQIPVSSFLVCNVMTNMNWQQRSNEAWQNHNIKEHVLIKMCAF